MTTKQQNNSENQEIDLGQISKSIHNFIQKTNKSLFKGIQFFIKNAVITSVLLVVGLGVGFYLDKKTKTYENQIIVMPNFGSIDYLYSKISLIQSKINEGDTLFLKNVVGLKYPKKLLKIEINPIFDVYKFVEDKPDNFELIKLMAEDGDIKKIIEDKVTSKNYSYHTIFFATAKVTSNEETVQPILNFLENSVYFKEIQKKVVENVKIKMVQNDTIIAQINDLMGGFSNSVNSNQNSDKLVYYNENTQLNDVIKTKDMLITEQGDQKVNLIALDKIVKDISVTLNIKNTKSINGKLKFILPLFLLFVFIMLRSFVGFYRKQQELSE